MAETLDTRPKVVNILHYAGDTLTIQVKSQWALVDGLTWNAQVRDSRDPTAPIAAQFIITPPEAPVLPEDPVTAYLILPAEITASLATNGTVVRRAAPSAVAGTTVMQYKGQWDCQISADGGDPVTTLAHGTLTLERDVTRI